MTRDYTISGTMDEMEPLLRQRGFTAVQTMGGNLDLADFDPYGMRRVGSINIRSEKWAHHVYRGVLATDGQTWYLADAKLAEAPFLNGLFPLVSSNA